MITKHTPDRGTGRTTATTFARSIPNRRAAPCRRSRTADGGYGFLGSSTADTLAELDADRRLIAAAPELLDALKSAEYSVNVTRACLMDKASRRTARTAAGSNRRRIGSPLRLTICVPRSPRPPGAPHEASTANPASPLRLLRQPHLVVCIACLLTALALAGCGGGDQDPTDARDDPSPNCAMRPEACK